MPSTQTPVNAATLATDLTTVVLQPTTLCNLDCGYCYLPHRDQQRLMSPAVSERVARSLSRYDIANVVDVIWHAGEPLATPIEHFRKLLGPFEHLNQTRLIRHGVQTNATLINIEWCRLIIEHGISVGISIDGPDKLNVTRRNRSGRPSFKDTMAGVGWLDRFQIPFNAICVVTADNIDCAADLVEFFANLGCTSVGFNIEEAELKGRSRRAVTRKQALGFWQEVIALRPANLEVREVSALTAFIGAARADGMHRDLLIDPMPTVAWDGSVVVLSPELAGVGSHKYRDFVVGNVLSRELAEIVSNATAATYVSEHLSAVNECGVQCAFFDFCRGGQAANRFFEHGHLRELETDFCRNTKQALVAAASMALHAAAQSSVSR